MLSKATKDKILFVYRYLNDSIVSPSRVDLTDNAFVLQYIERFKVQHKKDKAFVTSCDDLERILKKMCSMSILKRNKIRINPWVFNTDFCWSYSLTAIADTLIDALIGDEDGGLT